MIFDARSSSRRCTRYTFDANLVRKCASSIAESPPPITNSGWLRYIGSAPSHTAHADTPFCHSSPSSVPGIASRLAVAPVAMISVFAAPSRSSVA